MNMYEFHHGDDRDVPGITFKGGYAFVDAYTCHNYDTPREAPYSYVVHIINGPIKYFGPDDAKQRTADYDDRLRRNYPENWEKAQAANILPNGWNRYKSASLKQIGQFLSIVCGRELKCIQVLEGCNVANGYPYTVFITEYV